MDTTLFKDNIGVVSMSLSTCLAAVVLRSGDGQYMGSSAMVFSGISDPSTVEALACCEALALVANLSIQRMNVASDCKRRS
jgi:hypothetical protein